MTAHTLIPLHDAHDAHQAGGKATALARLAAAGLPVPDGIVIPAGLPDHDLPAAVNHILTWASERAPHGLIARSSAADEDGTTDSYAGIYASRFAPTDCDKLLTAVRQVRDSATSPTATAYARLRHTAHAPRMAVLVQPALRPHAAGILAAHLTATGIGRWRIEAVRGLAEPLVGGRQAGEVHTGTGSETDPARVIDQLVIAMPPRPGELDLPPGEWITLHDLDGTSVPAKLKTSGGGMLLLHRPHEFAGRAVLRPPWQDALLGVVPAAAETLATQAVDIEWVIDERGSLFVVQGRPLTAELPEDGHGPAMPDGGWYGIPASPGHGAGPAFRLGDDAPAKGAVLVCEALGPEAVDTLLAGPAAVVATVGGPLSHTAIIARELGIPCVTNITGALTDIPTGSLVAVNGTGGTVRPATGIPAQPGPASDRLAGVAVLTRHLPSEPSTDGRLATVLVLDDDASLPPLASRSCETLGLLIRCGSTTGTLPEGYRLLPLPDLDATLLWPAAKQVPDGLAVLGPSGQTLYIRAIAPTW